MDTTLEAMESRPEIIGARSHQLEAQSKKEFISNLSSSIQKIIDNPLTGEQGKTQEENLKSILSCYKEITKPSDPLAAFKTLSQNIDQPVKGNDKPS